MQSIKLDETKKFVVYFTVTGSGYFPIDMLRYSQCWPANNAAVEHMTGHEGKRTIREAIAK